MTVAAVLLLSTGIAAATTTLTATEGQPPPMSHRFPDPDPQRTSHRQHQRPYGTVMEFALPDAAPYPDDSRTTGFVRRNGEVIPYAGHYDDPTVAVVIPSMILGVRAGQPLDTIIHFHGHLNSSLNAIDTQHLGEQVQKSGRPVLLIVPQGPRNARDSGIGKLEKPGGLARLLTAVENAMNEEGPLAGRRMRIGNLAISGHSGGYFPVSHCLQNGGLPATKIREVWLMDAAYGRLPEIIQGLTTIGTGQRIVRSVFTEHLAAGNQTIMAGLGRAGRPVLVWKDGDDTVTSATISPRDRLPGWSNHPLDRSLRQHSAVFVSTELDHTGLMYEREYFRRFLEAGALGRGTVR
jgi:hypothetical protein